MLATKETHRVALCAWEIGRAESGYGAKAGGLGVIVEELPPELVRAAARQGVRLTVDTLSPCFGHYDRSRLRRLPFDVPVTIDGHTFPFQVFDRTVTENVRLGGARPSGGPGGTFATDEAAAGTPVDFRFVYFWDEGQLDWTTRDAIYATDPWVALRQYAAVGQAMAGFIRREGYDTVAHDTVVYDTVHLHDYHVGLVPFYLGDEALASLPVHLTIHNATYQGTTPAVAGGYGTLDVLNLPGRALFHDYFDFFGALNPLAACMRKVHETGGRITTVSGDLEGTWGYAAELRKSPAELYDEAFLQKGGPPGEVFVPNGHLDLFEKLPIAGITNGMAARNRPDELPELRADSLRALQARRNRPLFRDPAVQDAMLARDHSFDADHLEPKAELKTLLHRECFGEDAAPGTVIVCAVGRLVDQKNLGVVPDSIDAVLARKPHVRFVVLASATPGDAYGAAVEAALFRAAAVWPGRVWFHNGFDGPLSKLVLAGSDFALVPSRFEPCGLVDYEASLLGTVVIGRRTGGLAKVDRFAYLYDWLDVSDAWGESRALASRILTAVDVFGANPAQHARLVRAAMAVDASWDASAKRYVDLYRYGLLVKRWRAERRRIIEAFGEGLGAERALFAQYFEVGRAEYADPFDEDLVRFLREGERE